MPMPVLSLEELLERTRTFAREEMRPAGLAFEESEEPPVALRARAAELGLTAFDMPVEHGGGGHTSLLSQCLVIEELAWGDSPIGMVITQTGFFAAPLVELGTEAQKARYLPPLASAAPPMIAVAITEPEAGSDAAAIETTARKVDGGWVLDGHKRFIGNGHLFDVGVVFATVEPGSRAKGITAFIIEKDDPGIVRGPRLYKMGGRCHPLGELHLEQCFLPDDRLLGEVGGGFTGLMRVFDALRVQLAPNSLGIGRAALEAAVAHARERRAFGRPIGDFQAVSFRLADAKLKLDQARLLTHHAARLADAGEPFSVEAAMAKLAASEAGSFAADACLRTFAGAGYLRDSHAQKWFREARLDEIWDGTSDIMRLIIARSLLRG